MRRVFLSFILTLAAFVCAFSQISNSRERQITMDNGMPSNSVSCIAQDKRGFIWIGTNNGLSRYDGIRVSNFSLAE
jgi:ligand-binding sensor domain-containing protein